MDTSVETPPTAVPEERLQAFLDASKSGDARATALGEALLAQFPEARGVRGRLARARLADGDAAGALELALQELERAPGHPSLLKLAATAAQAAQGREAALPLLRTLADGGEDDGWANHKLAKYALDIRDGREALRRLELAEQAGRPVPDITFHRCRAAGMAQDAPLARRYMAQLPAEQQALLEKELRLLEEGLAKAAKLRRQGRLHALTSNQLKAWGAERGAESFGKGASRLFVTESGDMLGERVQGSRSMLMVFGGLRDIVGVALPRFDQVLRSQQINTLYLSDPRRLLLLSGLETFGDYRQSIEGLHDLMDRWGIEEIFCLGVSAGGYPAIAYGVDLGARRILTLAAPSTLVGPVMQVDRRASILQGRIVAAITDRELDLRKVIQAAAEPPEIVNYYGADSVEDVAQAENLRGLPNVILKPLTGKIGHGVPQHLEATGDYPRVIAELLEGRLPA